MRRRLIREESGIAMITVIMGILAITLMTVMLQRFASAQTNQADSQRREDTVLAGTEAMLERYAAKLTIDPLYYQRYVDEAEAPRICTEPTSVGYGASAVGPGNTWYADCPTWDYATTTSFFSHPLLGSGTPGTGDDVEVLLQVTPPNGSNPLEVTVVGRQNDKVNPRSVTAEIRPQAISEFARMVEGDLRYGSGAKTFGKVYVGNNIGYRPGGEAYADVFAENRIGFNSGGTWYGPPTWMNGAEGFDSTGSHNAAGERVTDYYPDPIDFDRFWDDLDLLKLTACQGGGICLDPAEDPRIPGTVQAYLLETVNSGAGESRIRVSYATATPPANPGGNGSCQTSEERWMVNSHGASWTYLDTFDLPINGALWASEHVVLGANSSSPFLLEGALTVYAGDSSRRRNVIIGSDLMYVNGFTGADVLGVVASDEIWINPFSVGSDRVLNIAGALLNQNGQMQAAESCGTSGSSMTPSGSTLNTFGSNASLGTGNLSCCFSPRNYDFDLRLASLRPPLFPLLSDEWTYTNWRESATPCWAKGTGCP